MTIIKTSELKGSALDWAVAVCNGWKTAKVNGVLMLRHYHPDAAHTSHCYVEDFGYSTDWVMGGPIIEREGIELLCNTSALQAAAYKDANPDWFACLKFKRADHWHGTTPLIAAMRCYVASKLGETVEVPEELIK
jgi:hypothetical protein